MENIALYSILFLSFILMVILSYINYRILRITIYMLEVTIEIRDISARLLNVTEQMNDSFHVKEIPNGKETNED